MLNPKLKGEGAELVQQSAIFTDGLLVEPGLVPLVLKALDAPFDPLLPGQVGCTREVSFHHSHIPSAIAIIRA